MKLIPLTKNLSTLVDDDVYEWASKLNWIAQSTGSSHYAARRGNIRYGEDRKKLILLHRVIADATEGQFVDHINRDSLDNRKENLRLATPSQNAVNRKSKKRTRRGSLKGACYTPELNKSNPWTAYINFNHKRKHLGYFPTEETAHNAYAEAAKELHGPFACL